MQLTNTPGKLVLPFANAGAKNTIPAASQIGITAGAASLTDGFPPLTRTPIAAGGVPPSGLDMNGILYALSAALRWAAAGGGYAFDATFAGDSNVNGYPKGARIMRSDGLGYWFNTVENNTTDPEAAGAAAAGWVPDFTNGVTSVAMASANVTLTPLQYGKPLIVISGALTANLNLIFPAIAGEWTVANNTTGAFSITCKTASGTGVTVSGGCATVLYGDGTNIYSVDNDVAKLFNQRIASAGGTADAITGSYTPGIRALTNGMTLYVRAGSANATTAPTFTPNSGTIPAKTIVKGANQALVAGDIAGAGHWLELQYDATLDKWILQNPATGVSAQQVKQIQSITASVAANALTIGLNPTSLDFRASPLTNGAPNNRTMSGAISLVVPSGATLGCVSGQNARLVLIAIDNAGTVELAVSNLSGNVNLDETNLISTTAISASANSASVVYSTTARTNVPFRVVGFIDIVEAAAGTWATAPTLLQGEGGQALASLHALGYGQTWQSVTRVSGTTYYNTTGRPIVLSASMAAGASSSMSIVVNGLTVVSWSFPNGGSASGAANTCIIPPGASYSVTATGTLTCYELR